MEIKFYKVLSYWREGQIADFKKESGYDSYMFELFKDKIESNEHIMKSEKYDLFVFRKNSTEKDFKERPINLVAGLYAEQRFKDTGKIYELIQKQIDVFDDKLQYTIIVNDDLLVSKNKLTKKYINTKSKLVGGGIVVFLLVSIYLYFSFKTEGIQEKDISNMTHTRHEKVAPTKETFPVLAKEKSKKKIAKQKKKSPKKIKSKIKKWKWDKLCKKHKVNSPTKCFESYIKEKCLKRNDFKISYLEYAKQHSASLRNCRYVIEYDGNDPNLKEAIKENRILSKQFFKAIL